MNIQEAGSAKKGQGVDSKGQGGRNGEGAGPNVFGEAQNARAFQLSPESKVAVNSGALLNENLTSGEQTIKKRTGEEALPG